MAETPDKRLISKKTLEFHGIAVGTIRAYSDGSSTCKLKKDDPLVQAMFNTLVDVVKKNGFTQDPEILHMFHYQMPKDEVEAITNNKESTDGTD